MTRRDYEVVAEIVVRIQKAADLSDLAARDEPNHDPGSVEAGIIAARVLKTHYPAFNRAKFFSYLDKLESEL